MKFNFKIQQYQTDAVEAVARVFAGQGHYDKISYIRDLGKKQPGQQSLGVPTLMNSASSLDSANIIGYKREQIFATYSSNTERKVL